MPGKNIHILNAEIGKRIDKLDPEVGKRIDELPAAATVRKHINPLYPEIGKSIHHLNPEIRENIDHLYPPVKRLALQGAIRADMARAGANRWRYQQDACQKRPYRLPEKHHHSAENSRRKAGKPNGDKGIVQQLRPEKQAFVPALVSGCCRFRVKNRAGRLVRRQRDESA